MSNAFDDARRDEHRNLAHPDVYGIAWYVTNPSSGMTQCVEADAEPTARWLAWTRWRGAAPADERAEAEYAALEVIPASDATEPAESGETHCAETDQRCSP